MTPRPVLSVVSPVYRAQSIVPELVRRIRAAVERITHDFEIVLVEDGSPDGSWAAIAAEASKDGRVKGVRLSRNFGQQAAIAAALAHARGDHVVVMDCDLQDNPAYIPDMYAKAQEGFDIVFARRRERRFGWWKNFTARAYYAFMGWLSSVEYDPNIGAFSMISRRVVNAFLQFGDERRGYDVVVLGWLGFPRGVVDVEHDVRFDGRSSYSMRKLLKQAIALMLTNSERPLHLSIYLGFAVSAVAILSALGLMVRYFTSNIGQVALGWTSLIVSSFMLSGLILISLGVTGLYIGRIFEQVKNRPVYVVQETRNVAPTAAERADVPGC